jgi:predicted MPP superfamily phosphohydrolase
MAILALTPLAQAFWFARAWRAPEAVAWLRPRSLVQGRWGVAALVVLAAGLELLAGPVIPRRVLGPWGRAVARLWLVAACLGFLAVTVGGDRKALAARDGGPAGGAAGAGRAGSARRLPLRRLSGGLPLLAAAYGAAAGRRRYRVVPADAPLANLPPALDGLRIVHLSDLPIGAFMRRTAIRRAADLANAAQPDLAVLTGALITSARDPLEAGVAEVSRLRAPLGVRGCHGNHERWAGVEARAQALFQRSGMHLRRQQCAELSRRGGAIDLIGVDDQRERARAGEPSALLRGVEALVRPDVPNILLSHHPDTFPRAAALGIELSLAGHPHGGQLRAALGGRQWSPARLVTPFVAGL